jgi:NAD-dependent oxidoreductase involved in siderophore biosynthesis
MNQTIGDPNLALPDQDIAVHVEIVRAGFHSAAQDMLQFMIEQGVENAPAAVLSGSIESVVQMWVKTMSEAGHPPSRVRESLIQQVKTYHRKHASS